MSILIKGMEMPKGRPVCIVIDAAGQARRYDLNNNRYADDELFEAVPVPSHGRLGDLDALLKKCEFVCTDDDEDTRAVRYSIIEDAPTIIPAEEGE